MPKVEKQLTIINKLGLHARAATQLVQLAQRFNAEITLKQGEKLACASSVLGLMMLESSQGKQVKIECNGQDAHAALAAIETLITQGFYEAE